MKANQKHSEIAQKWFQMNDSKLLKSAEKGEVSHTALKKWIDGTSKTIRDSVWDGFLKRTGLWDDFYNALPLYVSEALRLKSYKGEKVKKSQSKGIYNGQIQELVDIAKNSEISIQGFSNSLHEKYLITEQLDESLFGLFKRRELLVVKTCEPIAYGVDGEEGFEMCFNLDYQVSLVSLNGVISQKVLGFKEGSPCLYVSNEEWAQQRNYKENFRLVRDDESLVVYGEVLGKVELKSTLDKIHETNRNTNFSIPWSILSGLIGGLAGHDTAQSLMSIF